MSWYMYPTYSFQLSRPNRRSRIWFRRHRPLSRKSTLRGIWFRRHRPLSRKLRLRGRQTKIVTLDKIRVSIGCSPGGGASGTAAGRGNVGFPIPPPTSIHKLPKCPCTSSIYPLIPPGVSPEEKVEELVVEFLDAGSKVTSVTSTVLCASCFWARFISCIVFFGKGVTWKEVTRKSWSWSKIGVIWESPRSCGLQIFVHFFSSYYLLTTSLSILLRLTWYSVGILCSEGGGFRSTK